MDKKPIDEAWKKELAEIFKDQIDDTYTTLEYFLDLYPTKEGWIELQKEMDADDKKRKIYEKIRFSFKTEDEFENYYQRALKDSSLLSKFVPSDEIKEFQEFIRHYRPRTSGTKKLLHYFLDLKKRPDFTKEILKLRKKYGIPEDGYEFNEKDHRLVADKGLEVDGMERDLDELGVKFGLYSYSWHSILVIHLFLNYFDEREAMKYASISSLDLCKVVDEKRRYSKDLNADGGFEKQEEIDWYRNLTKSIMEREDLQFPISLRISPYASERDVLDYVKRHFYEVKSLQKGYRIKAIKIGKVKKKKSGVQERNEFIYKNKDLPRREIMRLVYDKFGPNANIDYGYIGKIISIEKKKRKDV